MRFFHIFSAVGAIVLALIILIFAEGARSIYSGLFFLVLGIVILRGLIKSGKVKLKQ